MHANTITTGNDNTNTAILNSHLSPVFAKILNDSFGLKQKVDDLKRRKEESNDGPGEE
jgi:hypothetical protein